MARKSALENFEFVMSEYNRIKDDYSVDDDIKCIWKDLARMAEFELHTNTQYEEGNFFDWNLMSYHSSEDEITSCEICSIPENMRYIMDNRRLK